MIIDVTKKDKASSRSVSKRYSQKPVNVGVSKARRRNKWIGQRNKGEKNGKKKFKWWYVPIVLVVTMFVCGGIFGGNILSILRGMGIDIGFGSIASFFTSQDLQQTDGRTNFLLVGIDTRPGSGLMNTDTLMVVTYDHDTEKVTMISVPRDSEVRYELNSRNYRTKVNGVYANAENRLGSGQGMPYLETVIEDVTGLPIHYSGMVNYYAFVQAIDEVDGLDICVETTFTDYRYPKPGSTPGSSVQGYEKVHFDAGCQHMDGETALKYARSRKGNNGEGSDYARSARQQKVVQAFVEKFKSSSFFGKYSNAVSFLNIFGDNIDLYNVSDKDMKASWDAREKVNTDNMTSLVLSPATDHGRLISGYSPVAEDWGEVREYVQFVLAHPAAYTEDATIGVYDGGAGATTTKELQSQMNDVFLYAQYKGKATVDCAENILGVTGGEDPATDTMLLVKDLYGGVVSEDLPVSGSGVDVVVIVCQ